MDPLPTPQVRTIELFQSFDALEAINERLERALAPGDDLEHQLTFHLLSMLRLQLCTLLSRPEAYVRLS